MWGKPVCVFVNWSSCVCISQVVLRLSKQTFVAETENGICVFFLIKEKDIYWIKVFVSKIICHINNNFGIFRILY